MLSPRSLRRADCSSAEPGARPLPRPQPSPAAQPPRSADLCRRLPPTAKTRAARPAPASPSTATIRRAAVSSPPTTSGELAWQRPGCGGRPGTMDSAREAADPPCARLWVPEAGPLRLGQRRGDPRLVGEGPFRKAGFSRKGGGVSPLLQPFIWLKEKPKQPPPTQHCGGGV